MKLQRKAMYPTSWVFTACNQSSCFVLAIWLSWNPVKFSCNWDFLVTTFLEENIEGTISCIPFCFPVESSLLFRALPSHKGLHLSLRSKGFALVSSGCCQMALPHYYGNFEHLLLVLTWSVDFPLSEMSSWMGAEVLSHCLLVELKQPYLTGC